MRRGKCISFVNLEVLGAFTSGLLVVCCVFCLLSYALSAGPDLCFSGLTMFPGRKSRQSRGAHWHGARVAEKNVRRTLFQYLSCFGVVYGFRV